MKNIFLIILLTISQLSLADVGAESKVRAIVKIETVAEQLSLFISSGHEKVPAIAANENIKKEFQNLKPGDEAMIEGHIHQYMIGSGDTKSFRSYLIIDSIHKVSLKDLGNFGTYNQDISSFALKSSPDVFTPKSIPVTTEVASAITMTSTLLLMESLSSSSSADPEGRRQMRKSLLISSGALATIVFIYEQITGKTKP